MVRIKSVFFDLDGTLIDSKRDISEAVNLLRRELGLQELSENEIISYVGRGTEKLLESVIPENIQVKSVFDKFIEYYKMTSIKYSFFYDGAIELLQKLKSKGYKKALITNKSYAVTLEIVNKYKLNDFFSVIYGGDSFSERKPSPFPLNQALVEVSLSKENVIYFGDSLPDYRASQSAGINCILANYGYGKPEELANCKNAIFVNNPLEVFDIVQKLEFMEWENLLNIN